METTERQMTRYLAAVVLAGAVITAASAQNPAAPNAAPHQQGQWRASKLVGVKVYNDNNEKIGDVDDIVLGKGGKIDAVVLAVGGFLGMGERYVAVPFEKLKWVGEPASSATAQRPTVALNNAGAATGEVNRFNHPERAANHNWAPDHAVFNASKDELKAMPQFRY
jgi:sporulation protein YlmC with PRC-barrel domain